MRVLVVDDQSSIRSLIKDVTEASNGVVALQELRDPALYTLRVLMLTSEQSRERAQDRCAQGPGRRGQALQARHPAQGRQVFARPTLPDLIPAPPSVEATAPAEN